MRPYNRAWKIELRISAVGFDTCQLPLIPEQQAIDTLKRGFELGMNWVHTAPDYAGADDLVARAIAESGHDVMALSQPYGSMAHFECLFESTRRKFHKTCLEMFGIACIEDREALGGQVWVLEEWKLANVYRRQVRKAPAQLPDFPRRSHVQPRGRLTAALGNPSRLSSPVPSRLHHLLVTAESPLASLVRGSLEEKAEHAEAAAYEGHGSRHGQSIPRRVPCHLAVRVSRF